MQESAFRGDTSKGRTAGGHAQKRVVSATAFLEVAEHNEEEGGVRARPTEALEC
jgi:hypothetical protein